MSLGQVRLGLLAAMLLGLAACTDSTEPATEFGVTGTISLSGAITGSYKTRPIKVRCLMANSTYCSVSINGVQEVPVVGAVLYFPAAPAVGTYRHSDPNISGSAGFGESLNSNARFWSTYASSGAPSVGAFSLVVTGLSAPTPDSSGLEVWYIVHGTYDATLVGGTSTSTGTIAMHIVF